jgi:FkbM family methyltransferase
MSIDRLRKLFVRRARAHRLGVRFRRAASFDLPDRIQLSGEWRSLSLPRETGVRVAFVDILLDDCYGLQQLKNPPRRIVDIGAHVGPFGVAARVLFPHAEIHGYEPNPHLEDYLKSQARTARFTYSMQAVGLTDGRVSLDYHADSVQTQSRLDESGEIAQVSFAEVVSRAGGTIDFLKLDCEGAEWQLFADRASWKHIKHLGMEYHLWPNHSCDEVRQVVRDLGFSITRQTRSAERFGLLWASR